MVSLVIWFEYLKLGILDVIYSLKVVNILHLLMGVLRMNITTEPIRNKKQLQAILGYLKENSSCRGKVRLRNYVIAKTQLNTSLRISDVLPLKVSDIMHLSGNFRRYINLKEDKTGHRQRIAINDPLKVTFRMYIKEMGLEYDDFLFPGQSKSKPVTTTQIHRVFKILPWLYVLTISILTLYAKPGDTTHINKQKYRINYGGIWTYYGPPNNEIYRYNTIRQRPPIQCN